MATLTTGMMKSRLVNKFRMQLDAMGIFAHPETIDQGAKPYVINYAMERVKSPSVSPLLYAHGLATFDSSNAREVFFLKESHPMIDVDYGLGGLESLASRFRTLQCIAGSAYDEAERNRLPAAEIDRRVEWRLRKADQWPDDVERAANLLLYAGILANGYGKVRATHKPSDLFIRAAGLTRDGDVRAMILELAVVSLPVDSKKTAEVEEMVLDAWTAALPPQPDPAFDIVRAFQGISLALAKPATTPLAQPFLERMILIHRNYLNIHATVDDDKGASPQDEPKSARIQLLPRLIVDNKLRTALSLISGENNSAEVDYWLQAARIIRSVHDNWPGDRRARKNRELRRELERFADQTDSAIEHGLMVASDV